MKTLSVLPFFLLAGALPALSQTQTFTAARIKFTDPGPYSQTQLETAAGMHAGTKFTADDLSAAAQRLADTGYLGEVGAKTLPGRTDAITVEFEIKPIPQDQMLHVVFENFVWLTHDEITAALRTKAPLYDGYVPENNDLLSAFNEALTEALANKGIHAKVMHDAYEPSLHRPEVDVDYWVASPSVRVNSVELGGVPHDAAPLIQKAVNSVAGNAYSDGLSGGRTEERILEPLQDAGYIDAALSGASVTPTANGEATLVDIAATLHAGDVYRVSQISFAGCPLLSADSFAVGAKLHPGDIASREQLIETLKPIDAAYRREGYADVIVRAEPKEDAATHQVAYTVTVTPGGQYHIRNVTPDGLDAIDLAAFNAAFAGKTGDIYNPQDVQGFLKNHGAWQGLKDYRFAYKAYADPSTHTVDLVLYFTRGMVRQNITVFGGQ